MRLSTPSIPDGLAKLADGRDLIGTSEISKLVNVSPKTILKHLHLNGHFYGIQPVNHAIARLIQHGSPNNKSK